MSETLSPNLRLIGRYSVLRELRRDRYSVSYAAFDPILNRELIVKAVQVHAASGVNTAGHDRIEQAFARQAQAAGRMHHPHIVMVFDAGRVKNIGYLAIEKVDGRLLDELLNEGFSAGFLQAADVVARVADAVEFAHSRGVPHGHLSPSHVYLQADRMPKVMGFGGWIDAGEAGDFALSSTENVLPYFQDELSAAARRKDVQALGALLFTLLTGKRPDVRALQTRKDKLESPILSMRPTTPVALAEIADSALELNGTQTFTSAAQMRTALTRFLYGARGDATPPQGATITGMSVRPDAAVPPPPSRPATSIRPATAVKPLSLSASEDAATGPGRKLAVSGLVAAALLALVVWLLAPTGKDAKRTASGSTEMSSPLPADVQTAAAMPTPDELPPNNAAGLAPVPAVAHPPAAVRPTRSVARSTTAAPAAVGQGLVTLAVAPWGEVFVDGASQGISPPLTQVMLPAGKHVIEVRNGQSPPMVTHLNVDADQPQQIRHRFP